MKTRSLAIVLALLLPIGAHANELIQHPGTDRQYFESPDWKRAVEQDGESQWRATLAYCRENPGACVYHNVPLKDG